MTFRRKLQTLLLLLVAASCGLVVFLSLRKANRLAFELIQEKVLTLVVTTAPRIDGDKVSQLTSPDQDGSSIYEEMAIPLRQVLAVNNSGALPIRFLYIMRPVDGDQWEYVVDAATDVANHSTLGNLVEFDREDEKPTLGETRVDQQFVKDSFGVWLSAFAPIKNKSGETVAMLAADISAERINTALRRLLTGELIAMSVALIVAMALAAWLSERVTRPLTTLREFVRGIGHGDFSSRLELNRRDEFGELAQAINQMAQGLEERESLKGALVHYVRSQTADAALGEGFESEEVSRRVTVLVAELSGFRQLATRLGAERVFALLGEYFSTMIDIVVRHRGSLEQSNNDCVIAVFGAMHDDPHQQRLAIQASLAMQNALARLLKEWKINSNQPISLIIGIHTDTARVGVGTSGEALYFESVRSIIDTAEQVSKVGHRQHNALTISATTAESVQHTFPLTKVEDESIDTVMYRVEMPRPD